MKKLITLLAILIISGLVAQASDLTIKSDKQSFNVQENLGKFEGNVKVQIEDITVESPYAEVSINKEIGQLDEATFFNNPYVYQIKDGKKNEIKSNILKVSLLKKVITASGNVITTSTTDKKPTATILSDEQEFDTKTNVMTATGNASIEYDDIKTYSNKAVAKLNSNNELEKMELIGGAKITQTDKNTLMADRFSYETVSEIAISEGNAYTDLTSEDGNRIQVWSNYQQYDKKNNVIIASGNVRVHFKDYIAVGPKATVYPDKTTKQLNEVVFTGRSKITEKGRSIEANKIIMYMNPKDFYAEGDVITSIRNIQNIDKKGK